MAGIEERGVDAGRDLQLLVVADRPEQGQRLARLSFGVERLVEVDLDLGRLRAQLDLRVGRHRDRRLLVDDFARDRGGVGRRRCRAQPAVLAQPDRGLVRLLLLAIVVDRLVGMLALPSRLTLRELLLEPPGVEEDELGQLAGALGRVDRATVARATTSGIRPQWSR